MKNNHWHFVISGGGYYLGTENDFVTPWIKSYFAFMGITNVSVLHVKGTGYPDFDINKVDLTFK